MPECEKKCEGEKVMTDDEKLTRFMCAQSLFNISKDLLPICSMTSNICLVIAKELISKVEHTEKTGSIHTPKSIHNSNVAKEIDEIANQIREGLNG